MQRIFFAAASIALLGTCLAAPAPARKPPTSRVCEIATDYRTEQGLQAEQLRREQQELLQRMKARVKGMPASPQRKELEATLAVVEKASRAQEGNACPVPDDDARAYVVDVLDRIEDCGSRGLTPLERRNLYGTPVVEIVLTSDGRLRQAAIARSSGVRKLDQHTLEAIGAQAPFGPMPEGVTKGMFNAIRIRVNLRLIDDIAALYPLQARRPLKRCK
jgi:TonB family protein